jgi:dihydroorotate dehydrogenase
VEDFVLTAKLVQETGCKVLEVNLSCPNEGKQNLLCFDVENSKKVVEAIKNQIGNLPLIVKTGFYRDQSILENFVKTIGPIVEGIESINAVSCKILKADGQPAWEDPKRLYSGVCGFGIKECGIKTVKKLADLKTQLGLKYTILGVGGIMQPEDFLEYLNAGAAVALSATGAMWDENLAINARKLI